MFNPLRFCEIYNYNILRTCKTTDLDSTSIMILYILQIRFYSFMKYALSILDARIKSFNDNPSMAKVKISTSSLA